MEKIKYLIGVLKSGFNTPALETSTIAAVLIMSIILGLYEYAVYRIVSHKGFYYKSFNIALTILPLFIAIIILALQSSLVITLGTIGALAIVRFRTAVKDPVDMVYLLWSVFIGIVCGCQLYEAAVLTSVAATVLLIALNYIPFGKIPLVVVVNLPNHIEYSTIESSFKTLSKYSRVKSCNHTANGTNLVIEISSTKEQISELLKTLNLEQYTIIEYDSEDVL